jgi:hypothetical protein
VKKITGCNLCFCQQELHAGKSTIFNPCFCQQELQGGKSNHTSHAPMFTDETQVILVFASNNCTLVKTNKRWLNQKVQKMWIHDHLIWLLRIVLLGI